MKHDPSKVIESPAELPDGEYVGSNNLHSIVHRMIVGNTYSVKKDRLRHVVWRPGHDRPLSYWKYYYPIEESV